MRKHKFLYKDEQSGEWLIYCPIYITKFSSAVWSTENVPFKSCPFCKKNVNANIDEGEILSRRVHHNIYTNQTTLKKFVIAKTNFHKLV